MYALFSPINLDFVENINRSYHAWFLVFSVSPFIDLFFFSYCFVLFLADLNDRQHGVATDGQANRIGKFI